MCPYACRQLFTFILWVGERWAESLELWSAITNSVCAYWIFCVYQKSKLNHEILSRLLIICENCTLLINGKDSHLKVFSRENNWRHQEYRRSIGNANSRYWQVLIWLIKYAVLKLNCHIERTANYMLHFYQACFWIICRYSHIDYNVVT